MAKAARVVYVQHRGSSHYLAMAASNGEPLDADLHQFAGAPSWAPNGSQVAFFGEQGISELGGDYSNGNGIWVLDADTATQPARQIRAEDHVKNLTWSPNSQQLTIKTCAPECGLWLIHFSGEVVKQLTTHGSDSYPHWSGTNQLAFCSNRDNDWEIYNLDVSSGALTRVTNRPGTDITPVYSREGAEIYLPHRSPGRLAHYRTETGRQQRTND